MTILDSCKDLLEICRVKCGPSDEPILPGGRTNEQAMRDAMAAIEQFADLVRALDEADTAFVVINICDGLTPQARGCIRSAWPLIQQELAKIKGPDSAFAHAVAVVRQFPTGSGGEVPVEVRKLETGPMVGIDESYLEQDVEPVYSPYDRGVELEIPDKE